MKNLKLLISMCALVFMAMGVQAQSGFLKRASDSKTTDTLVNAATSNVQLGIAGFQNTIALQIYGTKLTGTTAATARLYASLDGVSYERIPSVKPDGTVGIDSLILTNVAGVQSKTF